MSSSPTPPQSELAAAFRSGFEQGLIFLDGHFRSFLLRFLKRVSGGCLEVEELIDCYQETFLQLTKLTKKSDFDPEDPLKLVFYVARQKAFDALRRRKTRSIAVELKTETLEACGWSPGREVDYVELLSVISGVVDQLPRQQRVVAHAYIRHCEGLKERNKYEVILSEVEAATGETLTVSAAKSAWLKAKEKIFVELCAKGYFSREVVKS